MRSRAWSARGVFEPLWIVVTPRADRVRQPGAPSEEIIMPMDQWILVLLIGSMAGSVGQLVRAIAGLAKSGRAQGDTASVFNASRLVVSLLVGATAGALAGLAMHEQLIGKTVSMPTILGLMGAGYAGADFIEAFAGKYFNVTPGPGVSSNLVPTPSPNPGPAAVIPPAPPPAAAVSAPSPQSTVTVSADTKPEPPAVG